jgi:hypothetical protein
MHLLSFYHSRKKMKMSGSLLGFFGEDEKEMFIFQTIKIKVAPPQRATSKREW